jgi:hypothetical protein
MRKYPKLNSCAACNRIIYLYYYTVIYILSYFNLYISPACVRASGAVVTLLHVGCVTSQSMNHFDKYRNADLWQRAPTTKTTPVRCKPQDR